MADNEQYEQADYDPSVDKESSKAWLNLIEDAERAMQDWQTKADGIDKVYASLMLLASNTRDSELNIFWANLQVMAPSIYSRPPVPVVVPRFRSRAPIPRAASEMLERCTIVSFEKTNVDAVMRLVRDDLVRLARGAAWVEYEDKLKKGKKNEALCLRHVNRRDWLCSPAREWAEVDWVAKRAWLTRDQMEDRFKSHSGDAYKKAVYEENSREAKDRGNRDPILKCGVWEVWCKSEDRVVWVTEGVDEPLESSEPYLKLEGFFPCPRPAYGTVQPDSLLPVPDMVYYKDQLEEINQLTARINGLTDALRIKGFYPGGGEIGDAVEAAMQINNDQAIMVPIANWTTFANGGDNIIWLPIDQVAKALASAVEIRRQFIDDVYQITGLSDIMRGSSNPNETLGAQEIKRESGSVRIKDRRDELVRVACDLTRISAEVMAENFDKQTLLDMSQMDMPTDAEIKKQVNDLKKQADQIIVQSKQQIAQAQQDPQIMAQAQANPEEAQKLVQQVQQQAKEQVGQLQGQAQKLEQSVTIEQVMKLLREQKLRPFVLDIETDSTIAPDENAQKQRATEFITAVGGFLNQAIQAVQLVPQIAPLMADSLKYVASQFRAGRELENSIDEFADQMKEMGQQAKSDPAADAAKAQQQADQQKLQMGMQKQQAEMQMKQADEQRKTEAHQQDLQIKQVLAQKDIELKTANAQLEAQAIQKKYGEEMYSISLTRDQNTQKHQQDVQKNELEIEGKKLTNFNQAQKAVIDSQQAEQKTQLNERAATAKEGLNGVKE